MNGWRVWLRLIHVAMMMLLIFHFALQFMWQFTIIHRIFDIWTLGKGFSYRLTFETILLLIYFLIWRKKPSKFLVSSTFRSCYYMTFTFCFRKHTLNVFLMKKEDRFLRTCIHYWELNKVTIKNKYPLPTTENSFNQLRGISMFLKIDQ